MNVPIEYIILFVSLSFGFTGLAFWMDRSNEKVLTMAVMLLIGMMWFIVFGFTVDNIILATAVEPDITENTGTQIFIYDVSPNSSDKVYNGYKRIIAIEIGANSTLIGERMNSVSWYLAKSATAPTTVPVKFGIFNSTGHMQIQIGTDVTISTINLDYLTPQIRQFSLGNYIIKAGDYIGFQWLDNTSTSANNLWYGLHVTDGFDGNNTRLAYMNAPGGSFTVTNDDLGGSILRAGTANIADVTDFRIIDILYPFVNEDGSPTNDKTFITLLGLIWILIPALSEINRRRN